MKAKWLFLGLCVAFASAETNATTPNTDAQTNAPQIVGQPLPMQPMQPVQGNMQMQPLMAPVGQGMAYGGVPQAAMTKIQQMYPGSFVTDIDWEPYGIEVELNGYLKVFVDHNGNILGAAYDD